MIPYLKKELTDLFRNIKSLDFKVSYIFISVAIITFLSVSFASPSFYYDHFGRDKMYSRIYWMLCDGSLMFILPVLSIKLILKGKLKDYGLTSGDKKFGLITFSVFLLFMLIVIWFISASKQFAETYPQGGSDVKQSLTIFIFYELCVFYYMLGWEFFWRGYMLFGLKEKFGVYSIFIQMIPFFILHKGKPEMELFSSIIGGLILGIQAYRARSFVYSWLLHSFTMLSIDSFSILRDKSGNYGMSFTDLFNVIKSIFN